MDILKARLANQGLTTQPFADVAQVVRALGAVQAQDYEPAKWALRLRVRASLNQIIEDAFNSGEILRTHVMRPTWHFILPEDVVWLQKLTSPNVKKLMASYNRKWGLDDKTLAKSSRLIVKALENDEFLTRSQLKEVINSAGIQTDTYRLSNIMMWAELEALIISGPRIGKQFSYALVERRASGALKLGQEESLAQLAKRYFTSHGPAQAVDFAWWSGLKMTDARLAIELIKKSVHVIEQDNKVYYFTEQTKMPTKPQRAFLLSVYDEFVIAYSDRSLLADQEHAESLKRLGNAFINAALLDGQIIGYWVRKLAKNDIEIKITTFRLLTLAEKHLFEAEARRFAEFNDKNSVVSFHRHS